MKRLVMVADLVRLRMFRIVRERRGHRTRNLLEVVVPQPELGERSADDSGPEQAACFSRGDDGMAERKGRELVAEQEGRQLGALRRGIENRLEAEDCDSWNLVVPASIRSPLLGGMSLQALERLTQVVEANLTKWPLEKLRERFM